MNKSWVLWVVVVGIVVGILVVFNYQGERGVVPLNEIFPDEETIPIDIVYDTSDNEKRTSMEKVELGSEVLDQKKMTTDSRRKESVFAVQVSSFEDKKNAQKMVDDLRKEKYPAYIVNKRLNEDTLRFRVYVGRFSTKSEAEELLQMIEKDYPNSYVVAH
jgi:hypothetical protein